MKKKDYIFQKWDLFVSSSVGEISCQVHPVGKNYSQSLYHILQMIHMHTSESQLLSV